MAYLKSESVLNPEEPHMRKLLLGIDRWVSMVVALLMIGFAAVPVLAGLPYASVEVTATYTDPELWVTYEDTGELQPALVSQKIVELWGHTPGPKAQGGGWHLVASIPTIMTFASDPMDDGWGRAGRRGPPELLRARYALYLRRVQ